MTEIKKWIKEIGIALAVFFGFMSLGTTMILSFLLFSSTSAYDVPLGMVILWLYTMAGISLSFYDFHFNVVFMVSGIIGTYAYMKLKDGRESHD